MTGSFMHLHLGRHSCLSFLSKCSNILLLMQIFDSHKAPASASEYKSAQEKDDQKEISPGYPPKSSWTCTHVCYQRINRDIYSMQSSSKIARDLAMLSWIGFFAGIKAEGLPKDLDIHHLIVNNFSDIEAASPPFQQSSTLAWPQRARPWYMHTALPMNPTATGRALTERQRNTSISRWACTHLMPINVSQQLYLPVQYKLLRADTVLFSVLCTASPSTGLAFRLVPNPLSWNVDSV